MKSGKRCSTAFMAKENTAEQGSAVFSCLQLAELREQILLNNSVERHACVGNLRQTLQGKGVIHKRVETAGVYPLVRPRGVSATPRRGARRIPPLRRAQLPAEVQRKTLRPLGANTLTQFAHPAGSVQKRSRPVRANTLTQFAHPGFPVQKRSRPSGANTLTQFACPGQSVQDNR